MKVYCPIWLTSHLKILIIKDDFKNGETFSLHEKPEFEGTNDL